MEGRVDDEGSKQKIREEILAIIRTQEARRGTTYSLIPRKPVSQEETIENQYENR